MSRKLKCGEHWTPSTNPVNQKTMLKMRGPEDGKSRITYHVLLCHRKDHSVDLEPGEPREVDISADGAMVDVWNSGWIDGVEVWLG